MVDAADARLVECFRKTFYLQLSTRSLNSWRAYQIVSKLEAGCDNEKIVLDFAPIAVSVDKVIRRVSEKLSSPQRDNVASRVELRDAMWYPARPLRNETAFFAKKLLEPHQSRGGQRQSGLVSVGLDKFGVALT